MRFGCWVVESGVECRGCALRVRLEFKVDGIKDEESIIIVWLR